MNRKTVTVLAPAKVNLYLEVIGKRPDGYHDIKSVMQALDLSDVIEMTARDSGIGVSCDNAAVPVGPDNIAYRAAEAFLRETGDTSGVDIHIIKRVPMAAGLGGGSSDAAAVLRGMELLTGRTIARPRLMEIATSLGADVPFFLSWPCALAEGIGERLTEMPGFEESFIVLVNPGFEVSTKWVYSSLSLGLTTGINNITLPTSGCPLSTIAVLPVSMLYNNLEKVTVNKFPQINDIKNKLTVNGALGTMMSGSGPTVFGIFSTEADAARAASAMASEGLFVYAAKTISAWPEPVISS